MPSWSGSKHIWWARVGPVWYIVGGTSESNWYPGLRTPMAIENDLTVISGTDNVEDGFLLSAAEIVWTYSQ